MASVSVELPAKRVEAVCALVNGRATDCSGDTAKASEFAAKHGSANEHSRCQDMPADQDVPSVVVASANVAYLDQGHQAGGHSQRGEVDRLSHRLCRPQFVGDERVGRQYLRRQGSGMARP